MQGPQRPESTWAASSSCDQSSSIIHKLTFSLSCRAPVLLTPVLTRLSFSCPSIQSVFWWQGSILNHVHISMGEAVVNQQLKEFSVHCFSCCGSASDTRTNVKVCLIVTGHFSEYCCLYFRVFFFLIWVVFYSFLSCGCILFRKVSTKYSQVWLVGVFFYSFSGGWQS